MSISPIGSVTSAPAAIEPLDPVVETITNAETLVVAPATLPTEALPPTGAASATLSAINAQLDNTNNTSGLLAQAFAGVALLSSAATLQAVYVNPDRPAIAPVEPIDRAHHNEEIETSG